MGKTIELIACEHIPEYTELSNKTSIEVKDGCEWDGHAYATCVGIIYDDGTVKSYFNKDKLNGNTEIFDKLRNDMTLVTKHVNLVDRETMECKGGEQYFVPYKVKDHCSNKPTVTDAYVDSCCNVHYEVEYEILLVAEDGFRKYITVEFETEGSFCTCFFDQVEEIESMFEEWFEDGVNGFKTVDYDNKTVVFYDETGQDCEIDIYSIRQLLQMITSIRVIKCKHTIID